MDRVALDRISLTIIQSAIEIHRHLGPGLLESIDFACMVYELRTVIVELKSVETLLPVHSAQLLSYLRLTEKPLGLLINFNVEYVVKGVKRVVNKF